MVLCASVVLMPENAIAPKTVANAVVIKIKNFNNPSNKKRDRLLRVLSRTVIQKAETIDFVSAFWFTCERVFSTISNDFFCTCPE